MNKPVELIQFSLNGQAAAAAPGETILQVAKRSGLRIPHLCAKDGLEPAGNCRACVVEIKGERALVPSCCRYPRQGMEVSTDSSRALNAQKMVLELLLSDVPEAAAQPITGGNAPAAPPITMFCGVSRFSHIE